jgi:hypothetical protein
MSLPANPKPLAESSRKPDGYASQRWLALARGGWIVLALLLLANFVASIPALCWLLRISVPNLENKQSSRKSRSCQSGMMMRRNGTGRAMIEVIFFERIS